MTSTSPERDYVLGTHDEEISRLALQHRVWRPYVSDAWKRAGFTRGQTLIDIGCGPGHASVDLAEIVGRSGRVIALERSRRFLDFLETTKRQRDLEHIEAHEMDLDQGALPVSGADGAWCRWVLAFVTRPRDLLARIHAALRPGGVLVAYEYVNYSTWQFAPRSPIFEEFVRVVMESWRATGGEPDVGLDMPQWLDELGFETRSLRHIVEMLRPTDFMWQWPKAFVDVGVRRLVDLGRLTPEKGEAIMREFETREASPHALNITPAVIEIIAARK